ncbi:MAG TPA: site-2 protease family protein [Longimicrobium sp.]|nr:site-2 protease family protein [Longimicrobium sp.]
MNFNLEAVLLALPILLLSLTAHEWGHAWVALKQGDDTAYMLGRVTMNPAAHVDPVGTLLFPAIAIGTGAPLLGWAKPVPVNPRNYRNYVRGDILVSIAGVCMNALLALLFALLLWGIAAATRSMPTIPPLAETASRMFFYGVYGNIGLIVFNLLPIPPLDGSHVFYHLLPPKWGAEYRKLYPYGFLILWGLVLTGVLQVMAPLIRGPLFLLISPAVAINEPLMVAVFESLR